VSLWICTVIKGAEGGFCCSPGNSVEKLGGRLEMGDISIAQRAL
jgi:hypothetical protein